MPKKNIYNSVASNHPTLNHFDLSYTNTTSMDFGYLYPVQCDEVYPGDVFKMSAYCHVEVMPMVAPVMSDMQLFCHTFFVPYRLIYGVDNEDGLSIWEKFISGGKDGDYETPLPYWTPSFTKEGFSSKTIWDSIGNPMSYNSVDGEWSPIVPDVTRIGVSIAPKYAYNFIWNNFYRDENLQDEIANTNEDLLVASFKKDYFTSALEAQQRGTAPALPVDISGSTNVTFFTHGGTLDRLDNSSTPYGGFMPLTVHPDRIIFNNTDLNSLPDGYTSTNVGMAAISASVDFSNATATTFNVSDLRLTFAIQRMLELNMTGGYRYTEWLHSHFGVNPTDARLDRPEYIGGALIPITVSPLTQNSETASTPQGTKVGIGSVDTVQRIGSYRCLEHGLIMTIVSIRPKPIYSQGVNRQWLRQTRFDYYAPELAYLSEQGIYKCELYTDGINSAAGDSDIFGYQAHFNEMRCKNNMITGAVREQFNYWTLDRKFDSRPALNEDFIQINSEDFNKIFAVQNEDPFIVSWSNIIDAYRPIPAIGTPGLIDHVYGGR